MYKEMRLFILDTFSKLSYNPFFAGIQTEESWYILHAFGDSVEILGKQTTFSHSLNVAHEILR